MKILLFVLSLRINIILINNMSDSAKKRLKRARDQRYRAKNKPQTISVFKDDSDEIRTIGKEKQLTVKKVISMLLATFLHTKKSICVDQSTQTMPDVYNRCRCGSAPPTKPMPPLARIQPSGPQQIRLVDRVGNPLFNGPKTPNIKVIKIKKSTAGVLRRESCMTPQTLKNLMQIGSNLQAAQPLQGTLIGSSQPPARCGIQVPDQGLLTAQTQTRQLQLQRVEPVLMSLSNPTSSGLPSDALTTIQKLSTPALSSPYEQNIIHDGNITASSTLVDSLSVSNIHGKDIPGSSLVLKREPVESMEDLEQLPDLEFSQAKCIDEKDNADDYIYDDVNVTLDNEKEPLDPGKKLSEATDHPVVKEEVLSDSERLNLVHSNKEESFFDPMQGQEFGSDSKLVHSETGWYEEEEEEKDEEEDEEDEMEDDEEIDYEAQERLDPTYDPLGRMPQHSSKNSKDKPGSSKAKSSKSPGDLDGPESNAEILEYDGDSDDEFQDKQDRVKKCWTGNHSSVRSKCPGACPLCLTVWNSLADRTSHLQTHIPKDQGRQAFKEALEAIENKVGKDYTRNMGWCEVCDKFSSRLQTHMSNVHQRRRQTLCAQCGKMIKACSLKMHQLSHIQVDEKDYVKCPKCPIKIKHQEYLRQHIRLHMDNVPDRYKCPTCGKGFRSPSALKVHEAIHRAVKPFTCSICDKSFTQRSNLRIHMRQHTGDKPYVCEFCEMAFTNKVSLKNHKKKLHGIDWWKERESLKQEDPETTSRSQTV